MRNHLLIAFVFIIGILSCNKVNEPASATNDDVLDKYISQRSNTYLKNGDEIHVTLKSSLLKGDKMGSSLTTKEAWIEPQIKGDFVWATPSEIVFKPSERFQNGKKYSVFINIDKILDTVSNDAPLVMDYEILPLSLNLSIGDISYAKGNSKDLLLKGEITSSDYIESDKIKKFLSVSQSQNNDLTVNWINSSDRSHHFVLENIHRFEKESRVSIQWDGKSIDELFFGKSEIFVPSIASFEVVSTKTLGNGSKQIKVVFSDVIDSKQNLDGLFRIKEYKGDYTYEIDENILNIYVNGNLNSPFELILEKSIKNIDVKSLAKNYSNQLSIDPVKPELGILRKGLIVPTEGKIIVPFKAKNLKYVDVEIFKLYKDNILQFLQYNNLNDDINQRVVGKVVHTQKVDLSQLSTESNQDKWVKYALDLQSYVSADKGAMYQVQIGFRDGYAMNFECSNDKTLSDQIINDGSYGLSDYGNDYSDFEYNERDNPCHRSYYMNDRYVSQNILASNIGLIVKGSSDINNWTVFATDLRKSGPLAGTTIQMYDYQQQLISESTVDQNGSSTFKLTNEPSFAIAKKGDEFGYINIQDGYNNSFSDFDVSGDHKSNGIDGYIYGDRGVWRPGDTMYISFVLQDQSNKIKEHHPVMFEIRDARGKVVHKAKAEKNVGSIYHSLIATGDNAPTGNWTVKVTVGNTTFTKNLKVETVKPNKLKINYVDLKQEYNVYGKSSNLKFNSTWLHGAVADGLKAEAEVQYKPIVTKFKNYSSFVFDDPARKVNFQATKVFSGQLDASGSTNYGLTLDKDIKPRGKLTAIVKTRVYEKSGNFSEDYLNVNANPYASYVGVKIPKSQWGSNYIKSGEKTNIPIVVVDANGNPIPSRNLKVGLYTAEWNWWYNRSYNRMFEYSSDNHLGSIETSNIKTNSKGEAQWEADLEGYGNYLIRICDTETGHCTGDLFYTSEWGYPANDVNSPKTFTFSADKAEYDTGESIKLKIPSNENAKILLTVENGSGVAQSFWVDGKKDEVTFPLKTDETMAPNIYVHAMIIQPYDEHNNDLPLRLYGTIPITINNPKSKLTPVINMASELKPGADYKIKVSESNGKEMVYTLAVVDEGLLDLTRFTTPNPHSKFFGKQALSVKTWDIYDHVATGYDKGILNMLSIGGDGMGVAPGVQKANRFKPVVTFIGPFSLSKKGTNTHELTMDNYVGSVRVMVVAANDIAYGSSDKTVPVKQALMVSTTLPRVLAPGETVDLGVNVFAMENRIKDVALSINPGGAAKSTGRQLSNVAFEKSGDKLAEFSYTMPQKIGKATFDIEASSGNDKTNEKLEIQIANPNPFEVKTIDFVVEKGDTKTLNYLLNGADGSNEVSIELYSVPPFKLGRRMDYLVRYPYGCLEQTTSAVFPQLYLADFTDQNQIEQSKITKNVNAGIKRLSLFQQGNGGFSYWPGNSGTDDWSSSYVGDFMVEAKTKGYYISTDMLDRWVDYQKKAASKWESNGHAYSDLAQAYRLYTLAKSGNADLSSMNRMRNKLLKSSTASYMLSNSYALIGQKDVAKKIVEKSQPVPDNYSSHGDTYGSELRDMALILQYYTLMDDNANAIKLIKEIAGRLSSSNWYSTQTTAVSLASLGKYFAKSTSKGMKGSFKSNNGQQLKFNTNKSSFLRPILTLNQAHENQELIVVNEGDEQLFGVITLSGQPEIGKESLGSDKHVSLKIKYIDTDNGNTVDVGTLKQGDNITAVISVAHQGVKPYLFKDLALSFTIPSGWEINNYRMSGMESKEESNYTYKDVKDARVDYFFNLPNKTVKTFYVSLTATYSGHFYKPAIVCHSMYDSEIASSVKGQWVDVLK